LKLGPALGQVRKLEVSARSLLGGKVQPGLRGTESCPFARRSNTGALCAQARATAGANSKLGPGDRNYTDTKFSLPSQTTKVFYP